jgi:gliding motility-associated-like protein
MKKILLLATAVFILSVPSIYAQAPVSWTVNASAYNNSMTVTAVLDMDSQESRNTEDVVAAFIGSDVRGVGSPITPIITKDRYITYFVVYSNNLNELVTFKLYNKTTGKVSSSVTLPVKFIADGIVGTIENPLVIKDNNVPSDLTLSNLTIQENMPASALVGSLKVADYDVTDSHTLTLLDGAGFEDNTFFEIRNGAVYSKSVFDFEAKSSYTIRVQAADSKLGKIIKTFQISVIDDNLPTVFTLSKTETAENLPISSIIGDFTVVKENRSVFDLSLVAGLGSDDNASFEIVNNQLRIKEIFDFEAKSSYKIRVQATNAQSDVLSQTFVVTVKDDNLPTIFTLSKLTIAENQPVGSIVGDFTVVKEDRSVFALSLINGDGAEDNASFEIVGNALKVKSIFDFEAKSNYRIRVQAVSTRGDVLEQTFEIGVIDDTLPTVFALSKLTIDENKAIGTVVGDFTVVKEDRNVFALTLVDGTGAEDNASFEIIGNALKVKSIFDFEAKSNYRIRVQAVSTRGDVLVQTFEIGVIDDKLPTVFALSKLTIDENKAIGTVLGDFNVVKEDRNVFAISLVNGDGAEDNASFEIVGNALKVKSIFDFEAKSNYRIRVQAVSTRGDVLVQTFEIGVIDDKLPTVFALSKNNLDENLAAGSIVGDLTVVKENRTVFALSLVDGDGGEDNASFGLIGSVLKSKSMFDFETKNAYRIRVKAENALGEIMYATYVVTVNDINDTPVLITLSNNAIAENLAEGTLVGTFTTKDQDKDLAKYSFFIKGTDYKYFEISGNGLLLKQGLDFEKQNSFQFDVISNDGRGGEVSQTIVCTVIDVNEKPIILKEGNDTSLTFSIPELDPKGTILGKVEVTDQEVADKHTFKIVSEGVLPFAISNEGVISYVGLVDYEKKSRYTFQVVVTDNGTPQLSDTVTVEVDVVDEIESFLAFNNFVSPNKDGINDVLKIENINLYKEYNLSIYNVRGQLVYSVVNYQNDWSGEGLSQGEYYIYFIGKNVDNEEFIYKEVFNLVIN